MTPLVAARLRIAALLAVGILVQTTFGADLRVAGVAPDFMLLLAICAGLVGGSEAGAVVGFFAGLLADLSLTTTPIGLTALAWCATGWGVGVLRVNYLPDARSVQPVIGFLAGVAGVVAFLVVGDLSGQGMLTAGGRSYLVRVALVEAVWNAVCIVPVAYVYARAARGSKGAIRLGRSDAVAVP